MNEPNAPDEDTMAATRQLEQSMLDAEDREGDKMSQTIHSILARRRAQQSGQQAAPQTPPKPEQAGS